MTQRALKGKQSLQNLKITEERHILAGKRCLCTCVNSLVRAEAKPWRSSREL